MGDKPLHVRVAEVLGCKPENQSYCGVGVCCETWLCTCKREWPANPPHGHGSCCKGILRYDTDWTATGPLIERFGINIDLRGSGKWWASCFGVPPELPHLVDPQDASTPLEAVCLLILKLKEGTS